MISLGDREQELKNSDVEQSSVVSKKGTETKLVFISGFQYTLNKANQTKRGKVEYYNCSKARISKDKVKSKQCAAKLIIFVDDHKFIQKGIHGCIDSDKAFLAKSDVKELVSIWVDELATKNYKDTPDQIYHAIMHKLKEEETKRENKEVLLPGWTKVQIMNRIYSIRHKATGGVQGVAIVELAQFALMSEIDERRFVAN
jgi:hypothetical protein